MRLLNRAVQEAEPAFADADPAALEEAVGAVLRKHPAIMAKLPYGDGDGDGDGDGPPGSVDLDVDGVSRRVTYRSRGGVTELLGVDPMDDDGAVGPAAAALANRLGAPGLVSFRSDPGRRPT
jgi:hypothetical protein